jgi:phosphatidate cytidylyltransferase
LTSTRVLAAIVGLAIVLPLLFLGGLPGTIVLVSIAGIIALDEYARMAFPDDNLFALGWMSLCSAAVLTAWIGWPTRLGLVAGAVVVLSLAQVTLRPGDTLEGAADKAGRYVLGVGWIAGLLPFLYSLRAFENGVLWVLLVMVIAWTGDTGAYFAGRAFGKHPLYPRVSPKKTVEGLIGGFAGATVGVAVVKLTLLPELTVVDVIFYGVVACALGVMGDLCESMLKRAFHVKDSGWIMPGHGGILDRIDSMLFVAPTVYAYAVLAHGV